MTPTCVDTIGHMIWAFPWDLLDVGLDAALEEIAATGVTSVSVATAYHAGRVLLPHNPRRCVFTLEPDVAYFRPNSAAYALSGPIPRRAAEYADIDPLDAICTAAARVGVHVQAWTVFLHNSRLGRLHPDLTITNVFGDRYVHALCPSHPAARAYVVALGADIARNYPISALDVEALGFLGYRHASHHDKAAVTLSPLQHFLLSVCFCPYCGERIAAAGADPHAIAAAFRRALRAWFAGDQRHEQRTEREGLHELIGEAATTALLRARDAAVVSLLADLRRTVPSDVALLVRTATSPFQTGGKTAAPTNAIARYADGLVFSFLTTPRSHFPHEIAEAAHTYVPERPTWVGVSLGRGVPECRDEAEFHWRMTQVRAAGFTRFAFYNYGLMPHGCLDWIAQQVTASKRHAHDGATRLH
jgi:hypothetical protein